MAEQSSSQAPQQPASQPSPSSHSYPSPNMQSSYAYPPPQGHSAADHFRGSPTVSSMPLPPLNLPPIRAIEGQSQAPSQQHQHPTMGSPLAQGVPHMSAYYPQGAQAMAHHPAMAMNITSTPHNIRYAIQPGDQKLMSGGRHKKEIKRRTKTGCLTCRKRRIKCDEAHPTCRNCQKSKRDCLGYDPIFKQQQGPAQLQPANTNGSPSTPASASAASPASAYSNVPQGYAPASNTAYPPAAPPNAHNTSYDFGSAIDPALAGSDNGAMSAPHSNHDGTQPLRHDVKPPVDSASPYSSTNSEGQSLKAKRLNVDDLFSVCGVVPNPIPQRHEPLSPSTMNEIRMLYTKDYAPGLDKLLETTWYTTKGWSKLENDRSLCEMFAHLIDLFRAFRGEDFSAQQRTRALEIQVVWRLLCLCRPAASPTFNGTNGTVSSPEPPSEEVRKRLDVLEHLMTNHRVETNPLPRGISTGENPPDSKFFETEFWYLVGQFASFRDDEVNEVENTLFTCRNILGLLENRDVLYSIMIARHLGSKERDFPQGFNQAYNNNNDRDPRTKLWVAKKFIEEEANGKGTTQVVQRLCDMAIKSWQLFG